MISCPVRCVWSSAAVAAAASRAVLGYRAGRAGGGVARARSPGHRGGRRGKLAPRTSLKIVQPADAGRVAEIAVAKATPSWRGRCSCASTPTCTRPRRAHCAASSPCAPAAAAHRCGARGRDARCVIPRRRRRRFRACRSAVSRQPHGVRRRARAGDAPPWPGSDRSCARRRPCSSSCERTVPIYRTMADRYSTLRARRLRQRAVRARAPARPHREGAGPDGAGARRREPQGKPRAGAAAARAGDVRRTASSCTAERAQATSAARAARGGSRQALYRAAAVELRAPQAGMVKDLATHTLGTVVSPGTVLLTLVPAGEELQADVLVRNLDVGFVHVGQPVKVKIATYPFQKYGIARRRGRRASARTRAKRRRRRDEPGRPRRTGSKRLSRARRARGAKRRIRRQVACR